MSGTADISMRDILLDSEASTTSKTDNNFDTHIADDPFACTRLTFLWSGTDSRKPPSKRPINSRHKRIVVGDRSASCSTASTSMSGNSGSEHRSRDGAKTSSDDRSASQIYSASSSVVYDASAADTKMATSSSSDASLSSSSQSCGKRKWSTVTTVSAENDNTTANEQSQSSFTKEREVLLFDASGVHPYHTPLMIVDKSGATDPLHAVLSVLAECVENKAVYLNLETVFNNDKIAAESDASRTLLKSRLTKQLSANERYTVLTWLLNVHLFPIDSIEYQRGCRWFPEETVEFRGEKIPTARFLWWLCTNKLGRFKMSTRHILGTHCGTATCVNPEHCRFVSERKAIIGKTQHEPVFWTPFREESDAVLLRQLDAILRPDGDSLKKSATSEFSAAHRRQTQSASTTTTVRGIGITSVI